MQAGQRTCVLSYCPWNFVSVSVRNTLEAASSSSKIWTSTCVSGRLSGVSSGSDSSFTVISIVLTTLGSVSSVCRATVRRSGHSERAEERWLCHCVSRCHLADCV